MSLSREFSSQDMEVLGSFVRRIVAKSPADLATSIINREIQRATLIQEGKSPPPVLGAELAVLYERRRTFDRLSQKSPTEIKISMDNRKCEQAALERAKNEGKDIPETKARHVALRVELDVLRDARAKWESFTRRINTKNREQLEKSIDNRKKQLKNPQLPSRERKCFDTELTLLRHRRDDLKRLRDKTDLTTIRASIEYRHMKLKVLTGDTEETKQTRHGLVLELNMLNKAKKDAEEKIHVITRNNGREFQPLNDDRWYPNIEPFRKLADRPGEIGYTTHKIKNPNPDEMPVLLNQGAVAEMLEYLTDISYQGERSLESGGILIGYDRYDLDSNMDYVEGLYFLPIPKDLLTNRSSSHVQFTPDFWSFAGRVLGTFQEFTQDHELKMVGWVHTHPEWGLFLSQHDTFVQKHYWSGQNHIVVVIDPRQKIDATPSIGVFSQKGKGQQYDIVRRHQGFWIVSSPVSSAKHYSMNQLMEMPEILELYKSLSIPK